MVAMERKEALKIAESMVDGAGLHPSEDILRMAETGISDDKILEYLNNKYVKKAAE